MNLKSGNYYTNYHSETPNLGSANLEPAKFRNLRKVTYVWHFVKISDFWFNDRFLEGLGLESSLYANFN